MSDELQKHVGLAAFQTSQLTDIDPVLLAEGFELIRAEKADTFGHAFKNHWRAVLWSMVLSVALIMDGFDGAVVSLLVPLTRSPVSCAPG
jgi:hypothetical protein